MNTLPASRGRDIAAWAMPTVLAVAVVLLLILLAVAR